MSQHYKKIEINHYNLEFEIDFRNDNKQQKDDTLDICALSPLLQYCDNNGYEYSNAFRFWTYVKTIWTF